MTVKPIVAATDGSEESLRAVEWAAAEAVRRGTPLRIVSVAALLPRMSKQHSGPDVDTVADAIRAERDRTLIAAVDKAAAVDPELTVNTSQLAGEPAQVVTASGADATLLAVGARGIGAFRAMLLGSVSRYAASHAACPVAVVHEQAGPLRHLVGAGIGDIDGCEDVLAFAFEEAARRHAGLVVMHAWHTPVSDVSQAGNAATPGERAMYEYAGRAVEDHLSGWRDKYPDVQVSREVLLDHPGRALVELSARADLIVIGRRAKRQGLQGPSAVRHAVLNHAHGTIVVVPSP